MSGITNSNLTMNSMGGAVTAYVAHTYGTEWINKGIQWGCKIYLGPVLGPLVGSFIGPPVAQSCDHVVTVVGGAAGALGVHMIRKIMTKGPKPSNDQSDLESKDQLDLGKLPERINDTIMKRVKSPTEDPELDRLKTEAQNAIQALAEATDKKELEQMETGFVKVPNHEEEVEEMVQGFVPVELESE